MSLRDETERMMNPYARKGSKNNRRQQISRINAFAEHARKMGAKSIGQIGRNHVINYWKKNRHLSPKTLYFHWLALCHLWRVAGKAGKPPEPFLIPKSTQPSAEVGKKLEPMPTEKFPTPINQRREPVGVRLIGAADPDSQPI